MFYKWPSTLPFVTCILCADCRLARYGRTLHTTVLAFEKESKGTERALMPLPATVKKGKAKQVNHRAELTYTHSKAPVVLNTVGTNVFHNSFSSCAACMHHNSFRTTS